MQWYHKLYGEAQKGLRSNLPPPTIHGSLITLGQLLANNTGDFMSGNARYREMCDTILRFRDHPKLIIRRAVIILLPRLAAFDPEQFATQYLDVCLQSLLGVLKKDVRSSDELRGEAFIVLGQVAQSIGPGRGLESYVEQITDLIKNAIDVRSRGYCLKSLTCWSMICSAVGPAVQHDLLEILGAHSSHSLADSTF